MFHSGKLWPLKTGLNNFPGISTPAYFAATSKRCETLTTGGELGQGLVQEVQQPQADQPQP